MDIQLLNNDLLAAMHEEAATCDRKRVALDLRTTPDDSSQRILNVLEPGTKVPIHKHDDTDESVICVEGRVTYILLAELPVMDVGGPFASYADPSNFKEILRIELDPRCGNFGLQVPKGVWHTIEVKERCTIFEAKDGAYKPA